MNPEAAKLHEQAKVLLSQKKGAEAGALMEQAIGLMGEDLTAEAASDYGRALSQQGRNEEALEALSLAIQAEGDNPKYRLNRAILREQLGDAMGAVIDLMPVIEAQPDREEVR